MSVDLPLIYENLDQRKVETIWSKFSFKKVDKAIMQTLIDGRYWNFLIARTLGLFDDIKIPCTLNAVLRLHDRKLKDALFSGDPLSQEFRDNLKFLSTSDQPLSKHPL